MSSSSSPTSQVPSSDAAETNVFTPPVSLAPGTTSSPDDDSTSAKTRRNVRKKALIVGINQYKDPRNNLQGCVPDALDMAETLKICGFPRTKIKLCLDEHATKEGIIRHLEWLTKDAGPNDVLVFFYSGHGSQVADLNNDEQDRQDEIICPHDISWSQKTYITDDELYNYFTSKVPKTVRTDVILDSCFSGTATRSLFLDFGDQGPTKRQRYLPPPLEQQFAINSMIPQFTKKSAIGEKSIQNTQSNCLWSACQENQVSWELEIAGQIRGAFTYNFCRILRKSNGNLPREEIYTINKNTMANDGYDQIPDLEVPNQEALGIFPFRKESEIDRPEEVKNKEKQ